MTQRLTTRSNMITVTLSSDGAEDVRDSVYRAAAAAALRVGEVAGEVAAVSYDLEEVAEGPSPWVEQACREVALFAARLASAGPALTPAAATQVPAASPWGECTCATAGREPVKHWRLNRGLAA